MEANACAPQNFAAVLAHIPEFDVRESLPL